MVVETVIGTHDGVFHCDDALACFLLKQLPGNENATIVRTRDTNKLNECHYVVDVGGVYDHQMKRYDHHQPTFTYTMNSILSNKPFVIKLSSAGLVYTHYGHEIIANFLKLKIDDDRVDKVFNKVYEGFIQEIDAIDNGITIADGELKYSINTNISSRVKHFLPTWQEESNDEILYKGFHKAIDLVGKEFNEVVHFYGKVWLSAKDIVKESFEKRFEIDSSGEIIVINYNNSGLPWKMHLFEIEKESDLENTVKFVIYNNNDSWRVQAVPIEPQSFKLRIPLHNDWLGFRDNELSKKSSIDNCVFVHVNGFIGGNKTLEGAIQMAKISIEHFKNNI